jgi:hypothetical protein
MQLETFMSWFSAPMAARPEAPRNRSMSAAAGMVDDRRYGRSPISSKVAVCWEGPRANKRLAECKGVNMSIAGAMVISPEPVPIGEPVYIHFKELRLIGNGQVRHCTRKKSKYMVGLEFRGSLVRSF